jgi:hypothetical protein
MAPGTDIEWGEWIPHRPGEHPKHEVCPKCGAHLVNNPYEPPECGGCGVREKG